MGAEGQYGSSVTISCGVQGLDDWQSIEIRHNNRTLYQVTPSGLFTDFTNSRIAINSTAVSNGAEVSLTFRDLHCEDDGQYQCMVDGNSKNTMNLVVNSKEKPINELNFVIFMKQQDKSRGRHYTELFFLNFTEATKKPLHIDIYFCKL